MTVSRPTREEFLAMPPGKWKAAFDACLADETLEPIETRNWSAYIRSIASNNVSLDGTETVDCRRTVDNTTRDTLRSPLVIDDEEEKYKQLFLQVVVQAIKENNISLVKGLYRDRPFGADDRIDPHSLSTPLHVAAYWGRTEIARFLLSEPDFIPAQPDSTGNTPAELAIAGGRASPELIEMLADVECRAALEQLRRQEAEEEAEKAQKSRQLRKPEPS